MKEIPLSRGYVALVDDEDYPLVSQYKWYSSIRTRKSGINTVYAQRTYYPSPYLGVRYTFKLHRQILNITDPSVNVDHKDRDGLNCQRYNLRIAADGQNQCNRGPQKNNKSGYKGVHWSKVMKSWHPMISYQGEKLHLGYLADQEEAALVYDRYARQLHGEFAYLNFPNEVAA